MNRQGLVLFCFVLRILYMFKSSVAHCSGGEHGAKGFDEFWKAEDWIEVHLSSCLKVDK